VRRPWLLFVTACGRLGFDGPGRAVDASTPDEAPDAFANCFADNFDAPPLGAKWMVLAPASPFPVTVENGQLQIALSPGAASYNGIVAAAPIDLADGDHATVELVQAVSQAGFVDCGFALVTPAMNRYAIGVGGGNIVFAIDGDRLIIPYTAQHRHLRFANVAGMLHWQTSPDRMTWTTQRMAALPSQLTIQLFAGAFAVGATDPGTAIWDGFKLATAECP